MKKFRVLALVLIFASMFTLGCAGMTETQQRALSGGAIGAAGGAALSAISGGSPAVGAGLGGAAGAVTGYILGEQERRR